MAFRSRTRDEARSAYERALSAVNRLEEETEDTRQQLSYEDYLAYKNQGVTPKTSKIQQTVEPDMASDAMASYAQYKNTQGAQLANYDLLSDDVKNKLSELTEMEDTNNTGLFRRTDDGSGIFGYKIEPNWRTNDITNQLDNDYGINGDTLDELKKINRTAKNRDTVNAIEGDGYYEKALQKNAEENYVRTYPEEIEYATDQFRKVSNNTDTLRKDITSYLDMKDAANADSYQAASGLAIGDSNVGASSTYSKNMTEASRIKDELKKKYRLTDSQFEDLAYYGAELDDYDRRQAQQEDAYNSVNTGKGAKDAAGVAKNSVYALGANVLGGVGGVLETAKYKTGIGYRDKHSPMNVNSDLYAMSNITSDYQSAAQQRVNDWNKVAGVVYGAAMSTAESAETGLLAPWGAATGAGVAAKLGASAKGIKNAAKVGQAIAGLTPFGANAYASQLSENVTSGQEMDEAMTDALFSAGVEVGTELLPFDHFWDIAQGNSRTARKVITNFIVQSGFEGGEEAVGDIADRIIDDIRHGDKSDFNRSVQAYMESNPNMTEDEARSLAEKDFILQTVEDFATGALSGAMGGAGATALSIHNTNQSANELFGDFKQQDYADFAEGVDVDDDAYVNKSAQKSMQDAKALAEKYSAQDKVSNKERRALYYAYTDAVNTEEQAEQEQYEREQEDAARAEQEHRSWQEHESKVDAYNKARGVETDEQTVNQSISEAIPQDLRTEANDSTAGEIHKAMAQAKSFDEVAEAYSKGINSTNENTRKQTVSNLDNLTSMLEGKGIATESQIQALKRTDEQIYQAGYTGEEIETATTRQKQIYNVAQQAAIEARSASNLEQRELMTQNAAAIQNEAARQKYIDAYQTGMNAQSYDRIANTIMAAGRNGMSLDDAMDKVSADFATVGGDEQALRSSLEGLYSHAQQQAKNDAVTEAAKALRMRSGVQRFGSGTVTDMRKDQSVALPEMRMIEAFAQMTGVDYYLANEDYEINGERIFDGETQGYYSPSDSTIYLNVNESGQLAGTSIHEGFVEFASVWAGEETAAVTKALHTALIDSLGTSKYNDLLRAYRNSYVGETNKTDADLDKEILADMAPVLLSNKESLTKFVDTIDKNSTPKEARTIKEKLANWLSGLADVLCDFLSEFKPTKYQQQVAEAQIQNIEELRDMLIEATAHAVQNYQQARMESLAKELGIDANPTTIVENVTTAEDAYQIAYDNFSNTVQDIAENQKPYTNKVDNDLAATFIDTARAFKQSVAGDEVKAGKVNEVIDMCRDDLFKDEQQNRRVGIKIDGYTPVYEGLGTHNVPHSDTVELGEYSSHGERPIDAYISIGKLTGAINAYEQKFGISDDTVRGYLDDVKKAVNGIQEAMDNGYAAEDGSRSGVISAEGEYFKSAMKDLKKYALEHVDGFKDSDINNKSTAASLRNIVTWQSNRDDLNTKDLSDEDISMMFGEEKNRYAVPYVRNSKVIAPNRAANVAAHDYTYDTLIAKDDIAVYSPVHFGLKSLERSNDLIQEDVNDVCEANILKYNKEHGFINERKLYNNDFGGYVSITKKSMGHGFNRGIYPDVITSLPAYFQNAIVINEADGKRNNADTAYVLVGAYIDESNPDMLRIVRMVVNNYEDGYQLDGESIETFSLYSAKQKEEATQHSVGKLPKKGSTTTSSRITIKQLLYACQDKYPNSLSLDVASHLNYDRSAYEDKKDKDIEGLRYSRVIKDSNDTPLTAGQQEYFKDSKAVDNDGRLKIMYHGTTYGGFTVFNTAYARNGFFFTDDKGIARSYSGSDTAYAPTDTSNEDIPRLNNKNASVYYQAYLNLKNPLEVNADGNNWKALRRQDTQFRKDIKEIADIIESKTGTDGYDYIVPNIQMSFADAIMDELYGHEDEFDQNDINRIREMADRWDNIAGVDGRFISYDGWDESYSGLDRDDIKNYMQNGYIPMNSNDYAIYAQQNGYDGVIFKDMVDPGPENDWYDVPSTIMVVFDSNQVKSVNNQNPTEDVDIRKSMKIDDNRNMNNEDISANRDEVAAALEKGKDVLKGTKVNKMAARNIAMEEKRSYGSAYDLEQFTNNLTKLFGYLHSGKSINYNDFVAVMQDVARPVVDAAYTSQASREDYAQFRNGINELSFSLTPEQTKAIKSAFGSMKAFERYYPEIHITEDGKSFAEQWGSLVELSRGLLDENTDAVDMPTALVDAMEALRPSMNNWEDNTQAAHDMALDIISKYLANYHDDGANKAVINEFVKSAEKEIKSKQKEWKSKVKADYNERLKAERAYQKEIASGRVKRANERSAEQIAKLRAKNATRIGDIRERQKRNHQLQQINKSASKLYQYLTNPTDQNHVPKDLQEPVMQLMASLDMSQPSIRQGEDGKWHTKILAGRTLDESTGRYTYEWKEITADSREDAIRQYNEALADGLGSTGARKWYDRMSEIKDMYKKLNGDVAAENSKDVSDFLQGLDSELTDDFDRIIREARESGKASIAALGSEDLKVINKVLKNVLNAVNAINRSYTLPSAQISEIAGEVMDKADRVNGRKNHDRNVDNLINFMSLSNATPETYMHGIGADKVTDIMIAAQNQKAWRIKEAQEFSKDLFKGFKPKEIESWDKEQSYLNGKVKATKAQMMTLYELLKRPDAQLHLLAGGFKVGSIGNKTTTQNRVIHLTMDEYDALINEALTDKEKAVADGMQKFMAVNCSAWGNETSMTLYGYEKFLDESYWPMTVDKTSVNTNTSEMMGGIANTIKNMGMTKATVSGANNALVLDGAVDVYTKHISDMAVYSSWAAPMQDMLRFFNYKEITENEDGSVDRRSTKAAIEMMFGTGGTDYFKKLVASIQGSEQSSFEDPGHIVKLTSAAKKAAVLGNIRVVVQQPTAIFRAAKMIDDKYLIMGSAYKAAPYYKEAAELRDRTSATFWLKNQGNIDGQITQSLKSQITGVQSFGDSFSEKTGALAGKADEITWAAMYRAVYAEQVDKLGKDKIGTKEFEDAVNNRFDHVMLRTQVYDGTITRSQFMRSTDKLNQLQSAFMAEPVKTYNVVLRDIIDFQQSKKGTQERKEATKAIAKDIRVLFMTAAANAAMQSLWDAFRNAGDPDEDDEFWARVKEAYFGWDGNLVDNITPWNNIPVIGDWVETAISGVQQIYTGKSQWTQSSDLTTSGAAHVIDAGVSLVKYARAMSDPDARNKNTQTIYGVLSKINRAASDVTGLPFYAIQRDSVAVYNVFARNVVPAIAGGDQLPLLYKSKTSNKMQTKNEVNDLIREGGSLQDIKNACDEAVENGNAYDTISSGITSAIKSEFIELYKTNKSAAGQMKSRIAEIKAYCSDKEGTNKKMTHDKKVEKYKKEIDKWLE